MRFQRLEFRRVAVPPGFVMNALDHGKEVLPGFRSFHPLDTSNVTDSGTYSWMSSREGLTKVWSEVESFRKLAVGFITTPVHLRF